MVEIYLYNIFIFENAIPNLKSPIYYSFVSLGQTLYSAVHSKSLNDKLNHSTYPMASPVFECFSNKCLSGFR